MKAHDSSSDFSLRPVAFSRQSRRGILLGLSPAQFLSAGIGAAAVIRVYAGGAVALPYMVPL